MEGFFNIFDIVDQAIFCVPFCFLVLSCPEPLNYVYSKCVCITTLNLKALSIFHLKH